VIERDRPRGPRPSIRARALHEHRVGAEQLGDPLRARQPPLRLGQLLRDRAEGLVGLARIRLVAAREPMSRPAVSGQRVSQVDTTSPRTAPSPPTAPRAEPAGVARAARAFSPRTNTSLEPDDAWTARAVAGLTELLDDPSPQVRDAAARSLSRLGARR